jgi:hypothetical protein
LPIILAAISRPTVPLTTTQACRNMIDEHCQVCQVLAGPAIVLGREARAMDRLGIGMAMAIAECRRHRELEKRTAHKTYERQAPALTSAAPLR